MRAEGQLDPDQSVSDLVSHAGDRRRNGPVLCPGEALEAQPRWLTSLDPPYSCRREEVRHDFERSRRDNRAEPSSLADPRPDRQRGDLAEAPGHGRPDVAPLDLIFKSLDCRAGDGNLSFELGDIEPEPLQARLAVIHPHLQVPFQAADLEAKGIDRLLVLAHLGLGAEGFQFGGGGTGI